MELTRDRLLVHARLRLLRTEEGGLAHRIGGPTLRSAWDVGNRLPDGRLEINDAHLRLEGVDSLGPGEEAEVLLEPFVTESWEHVSPGRVLPLHAGARVLGAATVLEVIRVSRGP